MNAPAQEVATKLALLREALSETADGVAAGAIRLRGADWFAWATAGADVADGEAEVLVTRDDAVILTEAGHAERLRAGSVPDGFTFHIAPWAEPELHDSYALGAAAGSAILSDRPRHGEQPMPASLRLRRMVLLPAEQERCRALGRDAAAALADALRGARVDWTDYDLAAAAAQALWRRGIQPAQLHASGARRLAAFGPAAPSGEALGARALLACAARRHGLVVRLARGIAFGALTDDEKNAQADLLQVEATGLAALHPGQSLAAAYHALDAAYRHVDRAEALGARDQGGIVGYAAHELRASPSTATGLETGMAFAFRPGFAGLVIEDTFLLGPDGLENLTPDPGWPTATVQGRARPLWLEITT